MKSLYISALAALTLSTVALTSCSSDEDIATGEGRVMIRTAVSTDLNVARSGEMKDAQELAESCIIWISNSKGVVRQFDGLASVPAEGVTLLADHYVAEAWTGDSVPASWTDRWFKGVKEFDVTSGAACEVDITCKIANVGASVNYDTTLPGVLSDYKVTVGHHGNDLVYAADETRTGFYMMPLTDRTLEWKFEATTKAGQTITKTGTIADAKAGTEYVIKITCTPEETEITVGGAYLSISVDEQPIYEDEQNIDLVLPPVITGLDFDISNTISAEPGEMTTKTVHIGATGQMTSVVIACDKFTSIGLGANSYDVRDAAFLSYVQQSLEDEGLRVRYVYDPSLGTSAMKITFAAALLNKMSVGAYPITITATDSEGRSSEAVMDIAIGASSTATVALPANSPAVWATQATLTGLVAADNVNEVGINYREQGTEAWTYAPADAGPSAVMRRAPRRAAHSIGDSFTVTLTGLKPGTTYEYCSVGDGTQALKIATFTTEPAAQLQNSSFEDWFFYNNKVWIPGTGYSAGQFSWDSGNHGSTTISSKDNITNKATAPVHSGTYSAELKSQFVGIGSIGALAAGNIFTGKYLGTKGTNGYVGFGIPFTSRPKAVRAWVQYTPMAINYPKKNFPSDIDPELATGKTDQGSFIVAVFTDEKEKYDGYESAAIVYTGAAHYFDPANPNVDNVIGYGKHYFKEATSGMIEVVLPITYTKEDVKAGQICVSFAASRWGDYFAGGDGSIMYVDDVELIY